MKNIKIYLFALLALTFGITSCDEEDALLALVEEENPLPGAVTGTSGSFDFSKYVSIGNSLTAGYMDGALYTSGQANSFPALLAQQLATSGIDGGAFNQPDINSDNGYSSIGPNGPLGRFELSLSLLRPVPTAGELPAAYGGDKAALNNFGVPGMRVVDVNDPGLVSNGLYARFASSPGTSTVLTDAFAANPTFFTYWLGNNDILGYAAGGGANEAAITPSADFQNALVQSLGTLVSGGAKGVVMTIPPIVLTPYFRAVPYNSIPVTSEAQRDQLNAGFAGLNAALDGLVVLTNLGVVPGLNVTQAEADARKVTYAVGANPILMVDDALTDYNRTGGEFDILLGTGQITTAQRQALAAFGQSRQATSNDLPTLVAATQLGTSVGGNPAALIGVTVPAADNLILSASEVQTVVVQSAIFNGTMAAVVAQVNAASNNAITLVDVQPAFMDLAGVDAQTAASLVNPLQGAVPSLDPFLSAFQNAAIAAVDGETGIRVNGVNLSPAFDPNGVMSTDGVHPNPRGHGIVANLIIDALNAAGANIPSVNVLALRGVITTD